MEKKTIQMQHDISVFLTEASAQLVIFLDDVLPSLFDDWWKNAVVCNLSFQQQRRIEQSKINSLASLDLAALLRVLDQNWYQVSRKLNLTSDSRHFIKEMQTIRNRWAHAGTEGFPLDDVYRDLDTIQRFATVINANELLINDVKIAKTKLLSKEIPINVPELKNVKEIEASAFPAEFLPGQIVFLKSNHSIKGAVVGVLPGNPENRIKVFLDGKIQTYYASQLAMEDQCDNDFQYSPCDRFHAYLTALQIQYPGLSTLYSLNSARVDFIPYQFRPVLRFIRSDRPRLLIADGVGVGKTIEAGLILRELQARRDIKSVLIICPRPLVTERKWENEMKRFDERFTHLDGRTLRLCINEMDLDGMWLEKYQKVILPYSLFDETLLYGTGIKGRKKRRRGLLDLDPPPRFDLVIVDEAHHIRNQDTCAHKAVRFFCDNAEAVVFLTATPIQLGDHDLFVLLNLLRPDLILDKESFEHMAEPNPFINQAVAHTRSQETDWMINAKEALDQAASTAWGQSILSHNPEFNRIISRISDGCIDSSERVQLISDIEALHTFSGIINRTRRRDIGDFTIRRPQTLDVAFTPAQQCLHDELLRVQAEIFSKIHGDANVKFMMTTIRRQAASCLYGLAPFLSDILNRHLDELAWEEADNNESAIPEDAISAVQSKIQTILENARSLDPFDPKLEVLRKIIRDKQNLPNNKVMLFSSFRHTLHYLYKSLLADGFRVGMIHGGTPDEERIELRNRFEKSIECEDCLDLLLFSEIGCEGLDYQFCDCIVNYDLPWNPMRVEQRIGRIDRRGQKSESIAIINMITPGTVDADIYYRCLLRIGVFNRALGGGEEILGEVTKEIMNIAENISLSEEERRSKLQQLADNKIRLIQEQEELEQRQMELFGIRLPEIQMKKEIEDASSFWLSPLSIRRLVTLHLQHSCGKEQDYIAGEKPLKSLRLSQDARNTLLREFHQLPRQNTTSYREWENWLKGNASHLPVTFESDCAMQHPEAAFIMPLHPLVKQASMISSDTGRRVITKLKVKTNDTPSGHHNFVIYQWQFHGIREDLILQPISSSELVTTNLIHLLKKAVDAVENDSHDIALSVWDELDAHHYKLWSEARIIHRKKTQELSEYRRESLTTSHRARIALLEEQLKQTSDEKIQKMRQSQIATAEADYARRIQELDIAIERADIVAKPVAYGILILEKV
ncbi:MAG: helicase-related protein [Victivallales bacterium]|jgi:SNF2 family DNA or RNA helicase